MGLSIYIGKYKKKEEFKELLFFRKVNFLLPFFDYTENCEDIEINKQQVEDLVDTCKQVLKEKSKAKTFCQIQKDSFLVLQTMMKCILIMLNLYYNNFIIF